MNELITINSQEIQTKEYNGQRVVTFKDIDAVHGRPDGTASRNFRSNRQHFIEGEDFYKITPDEFRTAIGDMDRRQQNDITLITETGYLMLVKSFTDDLAWKVQRELVNVYFRVRTQRPACIEDVLIKSLQEMKEVKMQIQSTNKRIDGISDIVALDTRSWREDAKRLIVKIAQAMGGNEYIKDVNAEIYRLVEQRAAVNLSIRLTNMRRRMADNGVCKSKRDKVNKVDIIAEDKKLIEIYIAIVKEMAIKHGIEDFQ